MLRIVLLGLLGLASASPAPAQDTASPPKMRVYVGTDTAPNNGKGIYLLELDLGSGGLTSKGLVAETPSPSVLASAPAGSPCTRSMRSKVSAGRAPVRSRRSRSTQRPAGSRP